MVFNHSGCPIRTSTDQSLLAAPRGFSQLTTSFFASRSLGIPRSLFSSFSRESRSTLHNLPAMQAFRDLSRFACETSVFSQLDLTLVFDFQTDFFLFFFTSYSLSTLSMISCAAPSARTAVFFKKD